MLYKTYISIKEVEMRPVTEKDNFMDLSREGVRISDKDARDHSPKIGDQIARNPNNHTDKWLISKDYFEANFKLKE